MRSFTLGIVATLLVLVLAGLAFALLGFLPSNADANPSHMEMRVAMHALDASMDRHAPRLSSPIPPTDDNLIDGMKIYTMNCALCHGTLDNKPSPLEHSFYPPVPQVILHPLGRSGVAPLLRHHDRGPLHGHALVEWRPERTGSLEGYWLPLAPGKTSPRGTGLLEKSLRCFPAGRSDGHEGHGRHGEGKLREPLTASWARPRLGSPRNAGPRSKTWGAGRLVFPRLPHPFIMLAMARRARIWIYLLPLLHLSACAIIALAHTVSGVHDLIYVDFPFSLLLVGLGWRNDNFLFWFASLGTLWWFFLSWAAYRTLPTGWKSD